jgi:hypothetical protein
VDEVRHGSGEADGAKGQNGEGEDRIEAVEQGMHIPVVSPLPPAPDRLARFSLPGFASEFHRETLARESYQIFRNLISMLFHTNTMKMRISAVYPKFVRSRKWKLFLSF